MILIVHLTAYRVIEMSKQGGIKRMREGRSYVWKEETVIEFLKMLNQGRTIFTITKSIGVFMIGRFSI